MVHCLISFHLHLKAAGYIIHVRHIQKFQAENVICMKIFPSTVCYIKSEGKKVGFNFYSFVVDRETMGN
jgi:hypothetical protein